MVEKGKDARKIRVVLEGHDGQSELPALGLYAFNGDQKGKRVARIEDGVLIEEGRIEASVTLALGPLVDDVADIPAHTLVQFRSKELLRQWKLQPIWVLPDKWWRPWLPLFKCVSGRVRRCFRFPLVADISIQTPIVRDLPFAMRSPLFSICRSVCNGVVEVYERTCCCHFFDLDPDIILPRLPELIPIPWPFPEPDPGPIGPFPGPDPAPFASNQSRLSAVRPAVRPLLTSSQRAIRFAEATGLSSDVTDLAERVSRDALILRELPLAELPAFLERRPYLWHLFCHCSSHKIGETALQPDGSFGFCWRDFPHLARLHCHRSYYYVVKQWQHNQWVEIYNGGTRHEYFAASEFADLRAYRGYACGHDVPDVEHGRPFVMLQQIGGTSSHRLNSHWLGRNLAGVDLTQMDADRLAALPENGGLCDPSVSDGPDTNKPWAQSLALMLYFSETMKAKGARYYRLSTVPLQDNGEPQTGATPTPLADGLSWLKFVEVSGEIQIQSENLGPHAIPVGTGVESGLYRIPYHADAMWLGGQYHGVWNTAPHNDKFLLYIEVFDQDGNRLTPAANGFDFLRRLENDGPGSTAVVPHARLAHAFWVDNRPVFADIATLIKNGVASSDECQFMSGPAGTQIAVGFSAFHVTRNHASGPRTFMHSYSLSWHRGLNGPSGSFQNGVLNTPASLVPSAPATSTALSLGFLLGPHGSHGAHSRCTFSVQLNVYARHTNGSGRVQAFDRGEVASFALELTS